MRSSRLASLAGLASVLALAVPAAAQEGAARRGPAVGEMAPAFSGPGATRYGRIADPIQLSDYRGKTVVLAFFFRARTRG